MEVMPKLKSREDAIAEGAMALFGEKYGETVRTISILAPGAEPPASGDGEVGVHPTATVERLTKYSYELCGGTHLDRTSDVGAFIIVSEGSAAAGVRRIEAVTGRGAYALIRHRFEVLEEAAETLRSTMDEVPAKSASLIGELAAARRELAELRKQRATSAFETELTKVPMIDGVRALVLGIPGLDADTLRSLADIFRSRYPTNGVAVLESDGLLISLVTEDLVKRGLKAGDLIAAVGGRGGGRPGMAQGSLPGRLDPAEALAKLPAVLRSKLK
jgi:alanyl-tRNA synthetase